jgi:phenylalanine ammonia-lyase
MSQNQRNVFGNWQQLLAIRQKRKFINLRGDALSIPELISVAWFVFLFLNLGYELIGSLVTKPRQNLIRFLQTSVIGSMTVFDFFTTNLLGELQSTVSVGSTKREFSANSDSGVTTGFGGSANVTTTAPKTLQTALLQMQLSAILPTTGDSRNKTAFPHQKNSSSGDDIAKLSMPEAWVRGAMLIRCNSLLRGHSAVRLEVIKAILTLLEHDLVPLVPLRGSISASGDLCPLSYIAAVLEGNPDVRVWSGQGGSRKLIAANEALELVGLNSIQFGPKETLGLINGTAFSVAVASIAQHQADTLAILAQILTAMGVEALLGSVESFDPFIAAVRPHPGQTEMAKNIRAFLKGSKFARTSNEDGCHGLRQDRYALRTSSQWLGPSLEDMSLARQQIETELNSTTDNPLIDVSGNQIHHGGNFQATSISSSTEKTRMALEKIGKLLFAQSTELLDSRLAYNLPPNLAADEPSLSYTMKGVDINMAAYYSELAYLANPVSNHVQSAEMSNQALNSLALVSARYTNTAVDIVSLMSSAYLYTLCQALDLRAMHSGFIAKLKPEIETRTVELFGSFFSSEKLSLLIQSVWRVLHQAIADTTSKDSSDRFMIVAQSTQHLVVEALEADSPSPDKYSPSQSNSLLTMVNSWTKMVATVSKTIFVVNRESYLGNPDATSYLGNASKRMYKFVRTELGVPMHRGLVDHPTLKHGEQHTGSRLNTGSQISRIYQALRDETLAVPIMECLNEALEFKDGKLVVVSKL